MSHRTLLTTAILTLLTLLACAGSDKDLADCSESTWPDVDGDGHLPVGALDDCEEIPEILRGYADDCDDRDASVYPGADEVAGDGIDQDCDGLDEPTVSEDSGAPDSGDTGTATPVDSDHDGTPDEADCDRFDDDAFPGAPELCDGEDNDCDGTADEDDATDASSWYADADADGYGDPTAVTVACDAPDGTTDDDNDCDDTDPTVYPGADELADGLDQDCDGDIDEGTTATDDDGDGYSELSDDCDDTSSAVHPGAEELPYNGLDDDCQDGDLTDVDGDGYDAIEAGGDDPDDGDTSSYPGSDDDGDGDGYSTSDGDCDDADATAYPEAPEWYDGKDNDCDASTDEGSVWRPDCDVDGFGDDSVATATPSTWTGSCTLVSADAGADCDDDDAAVHPEASEVCDEVDNDCDSLVDDDDDDLDTGTTTAWFADRDGDGDGQYTDADDLKQACAMPEGFVESATDCDDDNPIVYPGAVEICDGEQNDCDASAWSEADEYGLVTFISDDTGLSVDYSTVTSSIDLEEDGSLNFCADGGVTTWPTNISVASGSVVTIRGFLDGDENLARTSVVLSGATSGVPVIMVLTGADIALRDLSIADGWASTGGGLWSYMGDVDITNVTFDGNTAEDYGSGVYVQHGTLTMSDVEVTNGNPTRAVRAYGAVVVSSGTAWLDDVTISDNYVESALFGSQAAIVVSNSEISGHAEGSGVRFNLYGSGGTLTMTDTVITNNYLGLYLISNAMVTLQDCTVSDNVGNYYGAGIFVSSATLDLVNTAVTNNTSSRYGGGLYLSSASVTLDADTVVEGNSAIYGGGIATNSGSTTLNIDGAAIGDNLGTLGGGLYLNGGTVACNGGSLSGNAATTSGSGAYLAADTLSSTDCSWDADQGIYVNATSTTYDPTALPDPLDFTCTTSGCY